MTAVVIAAVVLLAWSNGSNDNFKGVSTLYGSGGASYRGALAWATAAQLAGSLLALALAAGLAKAFSAKGLVPDAVATAPGFLTAAALGAAVTVLVATRAGLPVSTTHALTGALAGAGMASGATVSFAVLGRGFFLPLLLSPVLAGVLCAALYPLARAAARRLGLVAESCVCVQVEDVSLAAASRQDAAALTSDHIRFAIATGSPCPEPATANVARLSAARVLSGAHFLSAGAVCFARALNDTPKIAGLLLGAQALAPTLRLPVIALAMATGGLLGARRVAETMSRKISNLDPGQGLVASLTTATLVIAASTFALPVSTTHVATGGIVGIGVATGSTRWQTVKMIVGAWVTTLPLGAALGAIAFAILRGAR